jgi:hypothetical protein
VISYLLTAEIKGDYMAELLGAFVLVFLLTRIGLRLAREVPNPRRLLLSHGGAWLFAGTLYGFGAADGGPFQTTGYIIYGIPAAVLALGDYFRIKRKEVAPAE